MTVKVLGVWLAVATVPVVAAIAVAMAYAGNDGLVELLSFLFTVLEVGFIGVVLWIVQEEYKRSRTKADVARAQLEAQLHARSQARLSFLEDVALRLRHAYVNVKRVRRILKARLGRSPQQTETFDLKMLYEQGQELMDHQLELEGLKWETVGAVQPQGLLAESHDIPANLTTMENYVNALSKALMRFSSPPNPEYFQVLFDCVGKFGGSRFESEFGAPYDALTQTLMRERARHDSIARNNGAGPDLIPAPERQVG